MSGDMGLSCGPLSPPITSTNSREAEEEDMLQHVMRKMGRPYKQSTLARLMVGASVY